jgi:hypothetical protein
MGMQEKFIVGPTAACVIYCSDCYCLLWLQELKNEKNKKNS